MPQDSSPRVVVTITSGSIIRLFFILAVLWGLYTLSDIVLVLLTSVVIASAIEPITRWFQDRHVPRVLAVLMLYAAFFFLLAFVVYIFVPPLVQDIAGIASQVPEYLQSLDSLGSPALKQFFTSFLPLDQVVPAVRGTLGAASRGVFETAITIFGGVVNFVLIIVLSFYLAVQEQGIEHVLRLVTPLPREAYIIDLWHRSRRKIGLWMQGQLLLGLLIGVFAYLALTILGIRYALLLSIMAAVFELIPVFGPIMAAVPAVFAGLSQSLFLGLMVLGFYIIMQQFENHLIYPLVVRKVVGVPPLLVVLALIVGARLAGFLGLILAVPIVSALTELADDIEKGKKLQGSPTSDH